MLRGGMLLPSAPEAGQGGIGGIDEHCLALIRPVEVGGVWSPGDASVYARDAVNYSVSVGTEGSGPWGSSRALMDSGPTHRCFVVGGPAFGAVRTGACWFYPTSVGDANVKIFWKLGRNNAARPYVGIGYLPAPAPNASTHIRLVAYCAEGAGTFPYTMAVTTSIYPLHAWVFCGVSLPAELPGPIGLWAGGVNVATTADTTPAVGQSDAVFGVGHYWIEGIYDAVGRYAEAGIWSVERDLSVVPGGPYTEA